MRISTLAVSFAALGLLTNPLPAPAQSNTQSPASGQALYCEVNVGREGGLSLNHVALPGPYYGNSTNETATKVGAYAKGNGLNVQATHCNVIRLGQPNGCHDSSGVTPEGYCRVNNEEFRVTRLVLPDGWSHPDWDGTDGNLATATQRATLEFQPVRFARQESQQGYQNATIDVGYRFMVCAGEVHFAYSLDRQSLRHHPEYILATDTGLGDENRVRPDSEPPAPLTFPLDATIQSIAFYPVRTIAEVKDAIAGEALGMGCFSGQSKKIGMVAELVGPQAKTEQAKAFLEALRLSRIANIPFALTHPRPVDPAIRAERERQRLAALRSEAETIYARMMAEGGGGIVNVEPDLYPVLQQVIAENTARRNAEYEAQMAASRERDSRQEADMASWRASVAASERADAEWRAEVCRIDPARCSGE